MAYTGEPPRDPPPTAPAISNEAANEEAMAYLPDMPEINTLAAPVVEDVAKSAKAPPELSCCQMFFLCRPPRMDRCQTCAGAVTTVSCGLCLSFLPFCGCYACRRPNLWHLFWAGLSCWLVVLWGEVVGIIIGVRMLRLE